MVYFSPFMPLVGVDDDGAGAFVDQRHLHIRAELAVLDILEALPVHLGEEQLVSIHSESGGFAALIKLGR